MSAFNQEVKAIRSKMVKANGAYGRRHHSRGLTGFYEKSNAKRRPVVEFAGFTLFEKLLDLGMKEEAEALFQQLCEEDEQTFNPVRNK